MSKHLLLLVFLLCSIVALDAQIILPPPPPPNAASFWRAFVTSNNAYIEPDEDICDVVKGDGFLRLPRSLSDIGRYWSNFQFNERVCATTGEFTFETRFKNNAQNDGIEAYDFQIYLLSSISGTTGISIMGKPFVEFTQATTNNSVTTENNPNLLYDTNDWIDFVMKIKGDSVFYYINQQLSYSVKCRIPVCEFDRFTITSKGSGIIDYVKIKDGTGKFILNEDFNDCRNLARPTTTCGEKFSVEADAVPNCRDSSLRLTAVASKLALSYKWSGPKNYQSNQQISLVPDVDATNSGTYLVIAEVDKCQLAVDSISVIIADPVQKNVSKSICKGEKYTLPSGRQVDTSGTYRDTTQDSNGCNVITVTKLTVNPVPQVNLGRDTFFCPESSIFLNAFNSGTHAYQWSNGFTGTQQTVQDTGRFSVTVTNIFGCFVRDTIYLRHNPSPQVNIGRDTTLCEREVLTLNAANLGSIYLWQDSSSNREYNVVKAGTYSVLVTNQFGCINTDTIQINYKLNPLLAFQKINPLCNSKCNGEATVRDTGIAATPYRYKWITGDTTARSRNLCAGEYTVTVTDAFGCVTEDRIELFNPRILAMTSEIKSHYNGYDVSCFGAADGSAKVAATGGTGKYTFSWNTTPRQDSSLAQNLKAGKHKAYITDSQGCKDSIEVALHSPDSLQTQIDAIMPSCFGANNGSLTLTTLKGGNPPFKVCMNQNRDTVKVFEGFVFANQKSGEYPLHFVDGNRCTTAVMTEIPIPNRPLLYITPDTLIQFGDSAKLYAGLDEPYPIVHYEWSPRIFMRCDTCITTFVSPQQSTTYTLTTTDQKGCKEERKVLVGVAKTRNIFAANIFTPNGDGVNDILMIQTGEDVEKVLSFSIYNRVGNLMFIQKDFLPNDPRNAWDGTFRNQSQEPQVFIWVAKVQFRDGEVMQFSGDVTLLR